jgi:hypothetical protein
MKRREPKPAHPRWSSEESVQVAWRRPLVCTVGFIEILVGKRLEQLRGDRLVEHILSAMAQGFLDAYIRRGQMVDGPASCGHLAALRSKGLSWSRPNVEERATGIDVPPRSLTMARLRYPCHRSSA